MTEVRLLTSVRSLTDSVSVRMPIGNTGNRCQAPRNLILLNDSGLVWSPIGNTGIECRRWMLASTGNTPLKLTLVKFQRATSSLMMRA